MTTTDKPLRLQRTRKKGKGYLFPEGEQNDLPIMAVSRPSKWGNPYKIGGKISIDMPDGTLMYLTLTLEDSIKYFEGYIRQKIKHKEIDITELKGKNLACWCKLATPCHADVLLKIANEI